MVSGQSVPPPMRPLGQEDRVPDPATELKQDQTHDQPALGSSLLPHEALERQRQGLVKVVRVAFIVLFLTVPMLTVLSYKPGSNDPGAQAKATAWPLIVGAAIGVGGIVLLIDYYTPRKKVAMLFSVFLGLLGAMVGSLALGVIIDLIATTYDITGVGLSLIALIKVLVGIGLAYLAVITVLQTQDDFRLVIPYVEFAKQIRGSRPLLLDTSVLIDGRFTELAKTGLVQSQVVVPRFVVDELQRLADSSDKLKRAKGRRGMTIVSKLQRLGTIDVTVGTREPGPGLAGPELSADLGVDQRLIEAAKPMQAVIVTLDAGLAKSAEIHRVAVLNLHEVAQAMKPALLAGEAIRIAILKQGEQPGQGVGFLEDGTMVVVEGAGDTVGQQIEAVVGSTIQTSAGQMVFAKWEGKPVPQRADTAPEPTILPPQERDEAPTEAHDITPPQATPDARSGPFPTMPPKSLRGGSPRNPRR